MEEEPLYQVKPLQTWPAWIYKFQSVYRDVPFQAFLSDYKQMCVCKVIASVFDNEDEMVISIACNQVLRLPTPSSFAPALLSLAFSHLTLDIYCLQTFS